MQWSCLTPAPCYLGVLAFLQSCHDPGTAANATSFLCARCAFLESYAETHPKLAMLPVIKCALCPREGGVFKRTDKGGWVHLFCALLTLGVTFEDPDHLEGVVLKHVDRKVGIGFRWLLRGGRGGEGGRGAGGGGCGGLHVCRLGGLPLCGLGCVSPCCV